MEVLSPKHFLGKNKNDLKIVKYYQFSCEIGSERFGREK